LLLFVGSGYERKGLNFALKVLAKLPNEFRLMIVGKDKHESKYISLSKTLGLKNRCVFLGQQVNPAKLYCACDAFIFPTQYDPMPNAVLEAMSSSCVCYVSDASGASDYIENGMNGFVMGLDEPEKWAKVINHSFNESIETLGEEARKVMVKNNNEEMTSGFIELYLQVARN
jgi:UDP-glucose:(heptosyl)LPS alpha-1,3-glucosyltransferase